MAIIITGNSFVGGTQMRIVPNSDGVPVPNTHENEDWWYVEFEKDADKVVSILSHLAKVGVSWASALGEKLITELYG